MTKIESAALVFVSVLSWVSFPVSVSAEATMPSSQQQLMRPSRDKFEYKPINRDLWVEMNKLISSKKPTAAFARSFAGEDSGPESDEWKILIGKALSRSGMPLHAQYLLSTVAVKSVGTRQGFESLRLLVEVARAHAVDESALEQLAFDLDVKVDEPESRSMIGYFRARALMRKGYPEWAQIALQNVVTGTTFGQELEYDKTLQILNSGDTASAYVRFESIANHPMSRAQTARLARLALGRLIFERRDYQASITAYVKSSDLPTRERARTLNELAWSYYYNRQYGKALGAIEAVKSAYFRQLLSPETLIVEMLIYRELCHYRKVKSLVLDFQNEFKSVFTTIEDRKAIDQLPQIWQMALQEGIFQKRANTVQMLRWERSELDNLDWDDADLEEQVIQMGVKNERLVDAEITRMLKARVDSIANWFLDIREQVWFLDYESSMRMIQANEAQTEIYEPPKVNALKPDKMFWPIGDESWIDEILDYEVLLHDQCRGLMQRPMRSAPPSRGGGG